MLTVIKNSVRKLYIIDPQIPLHSHFIFWLPIIVFVGFALLLSYPTWCLCWPEPSEYEQLLKAQAFPVFIATFSIPFTVAINRFHSSSQRAKSNELMRENMTFNHYFEHRNHFFMYLDKMRLAEPYRYCVKITEPDKLYKLVFPLNKIDNQDMSAPKEIVMKLITDEVDSLFDYVNPYVISFNDGIDPFKKETANEFILKVGESFGLTFNDNIINYVDQKEKYTYCTIIDLCFCSILEVINKSGQFSHKDFGGWIPALALGPLLESTKNNEDLKKFNNHLESRLIFEMTDDKVKR